MTGLEIALFILGAAFVIISFFITADNEKNEKEQVNLPDTKELEALSARIINDAGKKADSLLEDTESRLEQLSNDKIMAVDEYSGQVIEKIDANHREVVFMYQMLQEKEEALKSTMLQLDNVRIECERFMRENQIPVPTEETAASGMPSMDSHEAYLDNNTGYDAKTYDTVTETEDFVVESEMGATAIQDTVQVEQPAPKTSASKQPQRNPYMPKKQVEKPKLDAEAGLSDKNKEIIALYKKKKSVLEISKLLGMGQGEVRLIIDLYCR